MRVRLFWDVDSGMWAVETERGDDYERMLAPHVLVTDVELEGVISEDGAVRGPLAWLEGEGEVTLNAEGKLMTVRR